MAPVPAPGRGPATCALQYLQSAGNFKTLIDLVDAASEAQLIAGESVLTRAQVVEFTLF